MRSRRLPLLLLVSALLAAAYPVAQAQKPTMEGYPAAGAPAVFKLLSPGTAPLRAIRYAIPATLKESADMATTMEVTLSLPVPTAPMNIAMSVNIGVTGITPAKDTTYTLEFTKAEVGPPDNPVAVMMQTGIAGVIGLKGTATVDARGVTKSVTLDLDKLGDPALRQGLGQMTQILENLLIPFPEQPIGIGARWETRYGFSADTMTTFKRDEYELVSVDGSTVTLKVRTEEVAPPQTVSNAAMPGMEMNIQKVAGSGTGTATVRLDHLVPARDLESTQVIEMAMGGQAVSVTAKLKISLKSGK